MRTKKKPLVKAGIVLLFLLLVCLILFPTQITISCLVPGNELEAVVSNLVLQPQFLPIIFLSYLICLLSKFNLPLIEIYPIRWIIYGLSQWQLCVFLMKLVLVYLFNDLEVCYVVTILKTVTSKWFRKVWKTFYIINSGSRSNIFKDNT